MTTVVATVLAALSASACSGDYATNPGSAVQVTVTPTTVHGASDTVAGGPGVRFSVDAVIHNGGPASIYLSPSCDPPIEHRDATGWSPAAVGTVCVAMAPVPVEIPTGTTLVRHIAVVATRGTSGALVPGWRPGSVAGVYRVHLQLTTAARTLLSEIASASAPFTILD